MGQNGRLEEALFSPKENFLYLTKAEARNINGPFNTREKTHLQSQIYAAGHFVLHCGSAAGGRLRNQPPHQTITALSTRKVSFISFKHPSPFLFLCFQL